jgi:hypothetical protein
LESSQEILKESTLYPKILKKKMPEKEYPKCIYIWLLA